MTVRRADWLFVLGAGLVVLFVSLLPSPRDRNPPVLTTPEHRGVRSEDACLQCHGAGERRPLTARHPKRRDCYRCHRTQPGEGVVVSVPGDFGSQNT